LKCFQEKAKDELLSYIKDYINAGFFNMYTPFEIDYYSNLSLPKLIALNNVPVNAKIVRLNEFIEQKYTEDSKKFLFNMVGSMDYKYSKLY
jgi:hypothetical protein